MAAPIGWQRIQELMARFSTAGRLLLANMATSATANRILRVGTANSDPAWGQVALATDVTGTLPAANMAAAGAATATAAGSAGIVVYAPDNAGAAVRNQAATPAMVRALLGGVGGGAPLPQAAAGVGQWRALYESGSVTTTASLPSGGTWAWAILLGNRATETGYVWAGVHAGGTRVAWAKAVGSDDYDCAVLAYRIQ